MSVAAGRQGRPSAPCGALRTGMSGTRWEQRPSGAPVAQYSPSCCHHTSTHRHKDTQTETEATSRQPARHSLRAAALKSSSSAVLPQAVTCAQTSHTNTLYQIRQQAAVRNSLRAAALWCCSAVLPQAVAAAGVDHLVAGGLGRLQHLCSRQPAAGRAVRVYDT